MQRCFDCTDAVVAAYSRNDGPAAGALCSTALRLYNESVLAMDDLLKGTICAPGAAEQTAGARAWLDAQLECSCITRLETLLRQLPDHVAVAVSAAALRTRRYGRPCSSPTCPYRCVQCARLVVQSAGFGTRRPNTGTVNVTYLRSRYVAWGKRAQLRSSNACAQKREALLSNHAPPVRTGTGGDHLGCRLAVLQPDTKKVKSGTL